MTTLRSRGGGGGLSSKVLSDTVNNASDADLKEAIAGADPDLRKKLADALNQEVTEVLKCYCGACTVTCTGEPDVQCFCHCEDCRRWGGATAQAAKLYPKDNVHKCAVLLGDSASQTSVAKSFGGDVDDVTYGEMDLPSIDKLLNALESCEQLRLPPKPTADAFAVRQRRTDFLLPLSEPKRRGLGFSVV